MSKVDVRILDRELRVACPEEEQQALKSAVTYLNKKMTGILDTGKIVNVERIAIMAALNIAHELLSTKVGRGIDLADLTRRITAIQAAIDQELAEQSTLFE